MVYERDDDPDGDGESVLNRVKEKLGGGDAQRTRNLDGECDNCGEEEGSTTVDREEGWELCRSCFNDPDVLANYVD